MLYMKYKNNINAKFRAPSRKTYFFKRDCLTALGSSADEEFFRNNPNVTFVDEKGNPIVEPIESFEVVEKIEEPVIVEVVEVQEKTEVERPSFKLEVFKVEEKVEEPVKQMVELFPAQEEKLVEEEISLAYRPTELVTKSKNRKKSKKSSKKD